MKILTVTKANRILTGRIPLPSSKSLSNRAIILKAIAGKRIQINNLSEADDTLLLQRLLKEVAEKKHGANYIELNTENAGTSMRFLAAYLSLIPGKWILTGSDRMKQRPIAPLVEALRSLGAEIEYLGKIGFPPLMIKGKALKGGEIELDATVSSQFISALLLIAPSLQGGLKIHLKGLAVSYPYVEMTLLLLQIFGISSIRGKNWIFIPKTDFQKKNFTVEADWSSAAFWYETAVFADEVDLVLEGLQKTSFQGDAIVSDIYRHFGIESEFIEEGVRLTKRKKKTDGFYFDFSDYPDIAPAVITTCAALGIRGRFEGLKSLRIKESDRIQALKNEYVKLGIRMEPETSPDLMPTIEFLPQKIKMTPGLKIESYNDHRMAMSFAPLAMLMGSIRIENPNVVSKSYPRFWEHMSSLGFEIS